MKPIPFSELPVWSRFDFDRSELPDYLRTGMIRGPWLKVSARCYVPTSDNLDAAGCFTALDGPRCQVGTVKVKVVPIPA